MLDNFYQFKRGDESMQKIIIGLVVFLLLLAVLVFYKRSTNVEDYVNPTENLKITSKAFENGGSIPEKYTGRGEDVSPPIKIHSIASKARSIAIIMDDIDHPIGVYNHWLIWNIPAEFNQIPEAIPKEVIVSSLGNAVQGKSAYGGKHYYRGPKPPFGTHKYIFKVYVLDSFLNIKNDAGKKELQEAMDGKILQYGTLTGKFGS